MAKLSAKHEAFVKLMKESEELARRGFDLLLKRSNPERFFDALQEAGLFAPSKNPAPVPAEQEGYVRIPYWSPLDYLVAVAKIAGERNDLELAAKVMAVVRDVSSWRDANNKPTENYHTESQVRRDSRPRSNAGRDARRHWIDSVIGFRIDLNRG